MRLKFFFVAIFVSQMASAKLPLESLNLPPGYKIDIYAEVENARQMTQGGDGVIYVGSRRLGKVFAVVDRDGDFQAEQVFEIDSGLELPSGVAYKDGDLYVAAVSTIYVYRGVDQALENPPKPEVLLDTLPTDRHHGWKFIDFGPDGLLYVPVGAPCNICLSENPVYTSILRIDVKDPKPEIYVTGVRNSVGFDWDPDSGDLWFTDNGRDLLGDEIPPCELNHVTEKGQHFGYPFFHGAGVPDPEFGEKGKGRSAYIEPALELGPHVAPLGMLFYTGKQLDPSLEGQILIAEHGSWNRSTEAGHIGYRITTAIEKNGMLEYGTLIDGWLKANNEAWGRPVDLLQLKDGSVLISDDRAGVIYRLTYES